MTQRNYLKSVGLLGASQVAGGIFAFFFTLVAARVLGVSDFGLFQAMMGIFGIVSLVFFPLNVGTLHYVGASPPEERPLWAGEFIRFGFLLASVTSLIFFILSPWLMRVLKSPSYWPFLALNLLIFLVIMLSVFYGIFYGNHRYVSSATVQIVESIFLLITGTILLMLGIKVTGAISGYLTGRVLILGYCLSQKSLYRFSPGKTRLAKRKGEFIRMMASLGVLFSIINLPMIVARVRLSAETSGAFGVLYHLRSTVWPLALSVAMPFYAAMVSGTEQKKLFKKAMLLISLLSLGFIAAGWMGSKFLISTLYGKNFAGAAPYMLVYGISLFLQMSLMIFIFRDMARNQFRLGPLFFSLGTLVVGLYFLGTNIWGLILAQILSCMSYFVSRISTASPFSP